MQVGVPKEGDGLLFATVVVWVTLTLLEVGLIRGIEECVELSIDVSPIPQCFRSLGMGRVILTEEEEFEACATVELPGSDGAIKACAAGGRFRFREESSNGLGWIMGTVAVGWSLYDDNP